MKIIKDTRANVAVIEHNGESYTFDVGGIMAEDALGVDAKIFSATTMLSRLYHLKGAANNLYYAEKLRLSREYWNHATDEAVGLVGKQKRSATDLTTWLQGQPSYQVLRETRDWLDDNIKGLVEAWIPRLRDLRYSSTTGEKQAVGAVPPQTRYAPVPVQQQPTGAR